MGSQEFGIAKATKIFKLFKINLVTLDLKVKNEISCLKVCSVFSLQAPHEICR